MPTSRTNEGDVVSPFGSAPIDANRKELFYAKEVITTDASNTPVTSPVTGTSAVTLNIPENAVAVLLSHDSTAQVSTVTFNGGSGEFGLVANQTATIPCAGESFTTLAITPGALTTNVYFAFELI